ncbi:Uncharacterised protein [Mycobacteroides abscessus subsp. bolletii]|nr:Uncharacterised protein [Mycobacteroides abscessus subsp. bolletii]
MITGGDVAHAGAHRGDDTGRLVSECHGHRTYPVPVDHRQIRVAQARGLDAYQHLAGARRVEFQLNDFQRVGVAVRPFDRCRVQHRTTNSHKPLRKSR